MSKQIAEAGFSLTPKNLEEAFRMAEMISKSDMVPRDYKGKAGNVLVAIQMGQELGLKPMQSLQNIAVINGRPAIWGDGFRSLIMSAPDLCDIKETFDESTMTAACVISRRIGEKAVEFTGKFSQQDAEAAGIWGQNTWKKYPNRMLQWRAFGFAGRDAYADRLKGIQLSEEVMDIPDNNHPKNMGTASLVDDEQSEFYPQNLFEKNLPVWQGNIRSGKKTSAQVMTYLKAQGVSFSEQQKKIIESTEVSDHENT